MISRRHRLPGPTTLTVATASLLAGVLAVALSRAVFPLLSIDCDEAIYRLHADALAHGRWFVPAPELPDAFRPWLSAIDGGRYVLKYSFLVPALLALSQALTGGSALALGLVAGATVGMTHLLAREVLGDRREALLATLLVAASPVVVIQSALLLPYLPTLLFFEMFAWGVLRGTGPETVRPRMWPVVVGGTGLGLAFLVRPYDAVLLGAPLLLWILRHRPRPAPASVVAFLLPVAAGALGLLAWNLAATGHPLRFPFSLLEPQDTLGFGVRRLYPTDAPHRFGPGEGLLGAASHALQLAWWTAGGLVLCALALAAWPRTRGSPLRPLAVGPLALMVGYVAFWGPWNASILWGGTRSVGPFYFLPVVLPVAFLGARSLAALWRRRTASAGAVAVVMVAVTGLVLVRAVLDNLDHTRNSRALAGLVAGPPSTKVVLARLPTPFLMAPSPVIANRWDLSGPVVYAIEQPTTDLEVVARYPRRRPYRLSFTSRPRDPRARLTARLEELAPLAAPRLGLRLRTHLDGAARPVTLVVTALGITRSYRLDARSGDSDELLTVGPDGAELAGRVPSPQGDDGSPGDAGGVLSLRLVSVDPSGRPVTLGSERLALRAEGGGVKVLVPTGRRWAVGAVRTPVVEVTGAQADVGASG